MSFLRGKYSRISAFAVFLLVSVVANAAQGGNASSVRGSVTDPSGAVIPGATVHVANPVSGFDRIVNDRCYRPIRNRQRPIQRL